MPRTQPTPSSADRSSADRPAADPVDSGPPPADQRPSDRFFAWIRRIDIRREPGWIGGVCAGIAARLGIDPIIVRGIAVVLAVLGAPALLLYAAAWLLLPDAHDTIHLEDVTRGTVEPVIAAIGAVVVLGILPASQGFWFGFWGLPEWPATVGRVIWTVGLLALMVWFVIWVVGRTRDGSGGAQVRPESSAAFVASAATVSPPASGTVSDPAEPDVAEWREQQAQVRAEQEAFRSQQASDRAAANRAAAEQARLDRAARHQRDRDEWQRTSSHPLFSLVIIGLSLVAGGAAALVFSEGGPLTALSAVIGLSTMLAVLALGIVINGIRGKRAGGAAGVAWIVLLPLIVVGAVSTSDNPIVRWGPTSTLSPTTSQDLFIGAGRVELDLTRVAFDPEAPGFFGEEVALNVGAGDITVIVPDDVRVQFTATVAAGSIDAGDDERSTRIGPIETVTTEFGDGADDAPQLVVRVQLGAGVIRVVEAGDNR